MINIKWIGENLSAIVDDSLGQVICDMINKGYITVIAGGLLLEQARLEYSRYHATSIKFAFNKDNNLLEIIDNSNELLKYYV